MLKNIFEIIKSQVQSLPGEECNLVRRLFSNSQLEEVKKKGVSLFGAGVVANEIFRALTNQNIGVNRFVVTKNSHLGQRFCGLHVVDVSEYVQKEYDDSVLIAVSRDEPEVINILLASGVKTDRIIPLKYDLSVSAAIADPTQITIELLSKEGEIGLLKKLENDKDELQEAYYTLENEFSRNLFLAKIVALVKYQNVTTLSEFLRAYSDPIRYYGPVPLFGYPESRCYFLNALDGVDDGDQFLIDVGAYDGCSVEQFKLQCLEKSLGYQVIAFEPDPENFAALRVRIGLDPNIRLENVGVWSQRAKLKFKSSNNFLLGSSSEISDDGDIEVPVISLDSLKFSKRITIIKADPPGLHVALEVLKGARNTITEHLPLLIFPAYHSFDAIYKMPLALKALDLKYKIFLRHLSWSILETDVFAVPPDIRVPPSMEATV
jgi:FkbM family methyltransferase